MTAKHTWLATVLILTTGTTFAQDTANHPETGDALAAEQIFRYSVLDDFKSIDPQFVEAVDASAVARDVFEGLLNVDATGEMVPGVATGFEVSEDKLTYTFTLRDNAKWSNGDPVVAGDFVYGLQRAADPANASPYAFFVELMGVENAAAVIAGDMPVDSLGVSAPDDTTVIYTIDRPRPYFPQLVSYPTTFPANKAAVEAGGDKYTDPENFIGNGAYKLKEYVRGEKLTRVRNENYWDNDNTIIEESTALIINDSNQALTRYLAGEVDFLKEVPAGQFPRLQQEHPGEAVSYPSACSYYYQINLSDSGNPALQNPDVREALSLALDRSVITDNILAGGQKQAYTFTHWAVTDWTPPKLEIADMTQQERNVKAQELMSAAGYGTDGDPLSVEILYNTSDNHRTIAVAVSQMWKQTLGIDAALANQEWATFLDTKKQQNFEVTRAGWCADYDEPSTYLNLLTSDSDYNEGRYANAEVDKLMLESATSDDPMSLYQQVEALASADTAIIPIYHYASVRMKALNLANWPTESFMQKWYSKDLYFTASE